MIAYLSRKVPEQGPKPRRRRHQQFNFLDEVGRCLQEVIALSQSFAEQGKAFYWITLEIAHLLEVADTSMSKLRGLGRGASCEVKRVDYCTLQTSA